MLKAERRFQNRLARMLRNDPEVSEVATFKAESVLSDHGGLVVVLRDGSELQVVVIQYR